MMPTMCPHDSHDFYVPQTMKEMVFRYVSRRSTAIGTMYLCKLSLPESILARGKRKTKSSRVQV